MKLSLKTLQIQKTIHISGSETKKNASWKDISKQREFLDKLAKELNIKEKSDWYKIRAHDVKENGGGSLITNKYGGSLVKALVAIYPDYKWKPWKFEGKIESDFWSSFENQKWFLDDFAESMNIKDEDGWYIVSKEDIIESGGVGILQLYKNSIFNMLSNVYKDIKWKEYKFRGKQDNWTNIRNHRLFFDDLAKKLNIKTMEDWYSIKFSDVVENGGNGLLKNYYDHSLTKALTSIYKEHDWQLWRFEKVPKHYWDDFSNVKKAFEWLCSQLEITEIEDWYSISVAQLHALGCGGMLDKHGGFLPLLKKVYPLYNWDKKRETKLPSSKSQFALFRIVRDSFPNTTDIYLDYPHPHLIFSDSKRNMEFDILIPSLKLAFELQGGQHFDFHYLFGSPSDTQKRDLEKREACKKAGITLIEVPYWWDQSRDSLIATIHKHRPDLFKNLNISIQNAIPISNSVSKRKPKYQEFITFDEMPLYDSKKWEDSLFEKSSNWYIFRRKNGIRVYWNGSTLFQRNGKKIIIPPTIQEILPSFAIDAELWSEDIHTLDQLSESFISSSVDPDLWKKIRFQVFDLPDRNLLRFDSRLQLLKQTITSNEQIQVANYLTCNSKEELYQEIENMKKENSLNKRSIPESLILTVPSSFYRSPFSSFYIMAEEFTYALVLDVQESRMKCQLPNGKEFTLSIEEREKKPNPLTVISVKYASLDSNGIPILPSLVRQRKDLKWQQVLFETKEHEESHYFITHGKSVGIVPSCRGCLRPFTDRNELRIATIAIFNPPDSSPVQGRINFCLNSQCVQKAIKNYAFNGVHLPEFKGKVRVPPSIPQSNIPPNIPFQLEFSSNI